MSTFKTFLPEDVKGKSLVKPKICFTKTGSVFFNTGATELLKIKKGDKVLFFQSDENQDEWYVAKDPRGFPLRINAGRPTELICNCQKVKLLLFKSINCEKDGHSFPMAQEPVTIEGADRAFSIFTSHFKQKA